jgi:hypothetical protein
LGCAEGAKKGGEIIMGIITSIKFKIGNKEIELTEEEARQLQDSLNEIFNEKQFLPGIAPVIITRPWW